jgi:hypothetical protein
MPLSDSLEEHESPYVAPQSELRTLPIADEQVPQQINWRMTIVAWMVFLGGYSLFLITEYIVRSSLPEKRFLAYPDVIWFGFPMVLGGISLACFCAATTHMTSWLKRIILIGLQMMLGVLMYLVICLNYVLQTGLSL